MGQAGGADHQGEHQGDEVIKIAHAPGQVGAAHLLQFIAAQRPRSDLAAHQVGEDGAVLELRQDARPAGLPDQHPERDEEGGDEHHVLDLLVARDAGHAGEQHVGADDAGGEEDAAGVAHAEDPAADQPDSLELGGGVGDGDDDGYPGGDQAHAVRVVAVAEELGDGVLAEAAQVGGDQAQQQNIAAGPADDVAQTEPPLEVEQAGYAHEGGRRHPVGGDGRSVAQFADAASGHPVAGGFGDLGEEADADVDAQQRDHDQGGNELEALLDLVDLFAGGEGRSGAGENDGQGCSEARQVFAHRMMFHLRLWRVHSSSGCTVRVFQSRQ